MNSLNVTLLINSDYYFCSYHNIVDYYHCSVYMTKPNNTHFYLDVFHSSSHKIRGFNYICSLDNNILLSL